MKNLLNLLNSVYYMDKIIFIAKLFFISICTYYTFGKVTKTKPISKRLTACIAVVLGIICVIGGELKYKLDYLSCITFLIFSMSILYKITNKYDYIYNLVCIIICLSINYVIYFIVIILSFIPNYFIAYQNNYINLCIIIMLHTLIVYFLFKTKRFKDGFQFLQENNKSDYFNLMILNISTTIILSCVIGKSGTIFHALKLMLILVLLSTIIIMTIKKTITMYYKHKMLIKDLDETKEELEKTKKDRDRVEQENIEISKRAHTISHKIKSLNRKIDKLMMNNEIANELTIKDEIKQISREYYKNKVMTELDKTGIEIVDDMLDCMKEECIENSIDFELQINGNIHHMVNNYIPKEELQILLADHIKDAIIAIRHSDNINRSILVRIGLIEGIYSLYIYDSGIEFEIDTLINLGTKPITTHKEEGGTGMGFLNTFDTLKKHNATMIIDEIGKESKDNYTKVIMIKFDNKSEFEIKSYRDLDITKRREETIKLT